MGIGIHSNALDVCTILYN